MLLLFSGITLYNTHRRLQQGQDFWLAYNKIARMPTSPPMSSP